MFKTHKKSFFIIFICLYFNIYSISSYSICALCSSDELLFTDLNSVYCLTRPNSISFQNCCGIVSEETTTCLECDPGFIVSPSINGEFDGRDAIGCVAQGQNEAPTPSICSIWSTDYLIVTENPISFILRTFSPLLSNCCGLQSGTTYKCLECDPGYTVSSQITGCIKGSPTLPTKTIRLQNVASPSGSSLCLEIQNIICGKLSTAKLQICNTRTGYTRQEFKLVDRSSKCGISGAPKCFSVGFAKKTAVGLVFRNSGSSLSSAEYTNADRTDFDFEISEHMVTLNGSEVKTYKFKLVNSGTTYFLVAKSDQATLAADDEVGWSTDNPTAGASGSENLRGLWLLPQVSRG